MLKWAFGVGIVLVDPSMLSNAVRMGSFEFSATKSPADSYGGIVLQGHRMLTVYIEKGFVEFIKTLITMMTYICLNTLYKLTKLIISTALEVGY